MTVLFLSPHLDDVAFSCGGTVAALAAGRRCVVATVFTRGVPDPAGFALDCQTSKGIDPSVDYMALRRDEDRRACAVLGARPRHLDLPEAPHRGYDDAAALFAGVRDDDRVDGEPTVFVVARVVGRLLDELGPDLLFAPAGYGRHADHRLVLDAVLGVLADRSDPPPLFLYRDAPYVIREPHAAPAFAGATAVERTDVAATLPAKLDACACYGSQLGFQFGGEARMRRVLTEFAAAEGAGRGLPSAETTLRVVESEPGQAPGLPRRLIRPELVDRV